MCKALPCLLLFTYSSLWANQHERLHISIQGTPWREESGRGLDLFPSKRIEIAEYLVLTDPLFPKGLKGFHKINQIWRPINRLWKKSEGLAFGRASALTFPPGSAASQERPAHRALLTGSCGRSLLHQGLGRQAFFQRLSSMCLCQPLVLLGSAQGAGQPRSPKTALQASRIPSRHLCIPHY